MHTIGLKEVKISNLKLPGNWAEYLESEEVQERAKSIERHGLIHEPLVRKSDMSLIVGRRRVAAHVVNGEDTVMVKLIECTDQEAEELELVENLERHHASPGEQRKLTVALVDLYERLEKGKPAVKLPGKKRGRKKTPRGRAREIVAEQIGIEPESVRRAEVRERSSQKDDAEDAPSPILLWTLEVDDAYMEAMRDIQANISRALGKLRDVRKFLMAIQTNDHAQSDRMEPILEALTELRKRIEGHRPVSLCPACKYLDEYSHNCAACAGTGWATETQFSNAPKELTEGQDMVMRVLHKGKFIELDDYSEPELEEAQEEFFL